MTSYGSITALDLGSNDDKMKLPWDPNSPFETVIGQVEDAVEYAEDGNEPITPQQIVNKAYTIVYNTGMYFDDCDTWDIKPQADKTWTNFKTHFLAAAKRVNLRRHTAQQAGFHGANNTMDVDESTSGAMEALANLAQASITDRDTISEMQSTITKMMAQIQVKDNLIQQNQVLMGSWGVQPTNNRTVPNRNAPWTPSRPAQNQGGRTGAPINGWGLAQGAPANEWGVPREYGWGGPPGGVPVEPRRPPRERRPRVPPTDQGGYCWTHGYLVHPDHNSCTCRTKREGHQDSATRADPKGGSMAGKPP